MLKITKLENGIKISNGIKSVIITKNDRWITVKPHGDEEKGRHLLLEGDETPKEAMKRQWGVDVDKKKSIDKITDEEIDSRLNDLRKERKKIYDSIDEKIRNNPEYKKKKEEEEKLKEEYYSLRFEDPRHLEVSKKIDSLQDDIRHLMYKIEDEERQKEKESFDRLNAKIDELQSEKNRRNLEKTKKEIEEAKKAEEKRLQEAEQKKQKLIADAKQNVYPKEIVGVAKGKEMTDEEADGNTPNPNFSEGGGYRTNCQSCVACYEMRKRGYNVTTLPNTKNSALEELSHKYKDIWLDLNTGVIPEGEQITGSKADKVVLQLENKIMSGERYSLRLRWKKSRYGHVVNMYRDNEGIILYDPQSGKKYRNNDLIKYLSNAKMKGDNSPELLRIDNLAFNPKYMNKIVKKY